MQDDANNRAKENLDFLNEYREPTQAVSPDTQSFTHSPLFLYTMYSALFIIVAAIVLYWRYKRSL